MMDIFLSLLPSWTLWGIIAFSSLLIGFTKTCFSGIGTFVVALMALTFGAKESTGILLPILCLADVGAVIYFRRSCNWILLIKLLIWAVIGLLLGIAIERFVPASGFKYLISLSILMGALVLLFDKANSNAKTNILEKPLILAIFGVVGGFATMVGNAAGPIMSVYLLSVRMPKMLFVGISAWFFMAINYLKLPLQIWVWDNINTDSLLIGLLMTPFIAAGSAIGIYVVKRISEDFFRKAVLWITLLSAIMLLF